MVLQRPQEDSLAFDPLQPPGNPRALNDMFPTIFRLASDHFPGIEQLVHADFFTEQYQSHHAECVRLWTRIFKHFLPEGRMVEADQDRHTLQSLPIRALYDFDANYATVQRRYRDARRAKQIEINLSPAQTESSILNSEWSVNTNQLWAHVVGFPRIPGINIRGAAYNTQRVLARQIQLLTGEITEIFLNDVAFKHRLRFLANHAQALRYLSFGNEIYGAPFGFLSYGTGFRRMILLSGSILLADLGPLRDEAGEWLEDQAQQFVDMTIHELMLYENTVGPDSVPTSTFYQLKVDSTIHDGPGRALYSFLHMIGQWYVDIHSHNPNIVPLELSGRVARVQNFTVEELARACVQVTMTMRTDEQTADLRNAREDPDSEQGRARRDRSELDLDEKDRPAGSPTPLSPRPQSAYTDFRTDEDLLESEDLMGALVHKRAEENGIDLTTLKQKYETWEPTPKQRLEYAKIGRAAMADRDAETEKLFAMLGGDEF